ncbi:sulfotransferase family protein [Kordiimonas aestuarii]|uniref:sulfotransferase family protein n=1 Tax=Kordiimonas aestuarii TaxID=1005925 RepID=UPI0021D127D2|nr:sulfotransferase [Kordiimonas aestuarii]
MEPVFCVSAPRAGSTLLTRILNCHSEIAAPYEIPIARYFFGASNESLVLDKTMQISELLGIDVKKAMNDSDFLFSSIATYEQKRLLIVKEPTNSLHLPRIRCDFGEVPLIHMVRDARQMMSSKVLRQGGGGVKRSAKMWYEFNVQILKYSRLFPSFCLVRYEDLTANPQQEITRVLEFLGLKFEEGMLEYWNFRHSDEKLALWDGQRPKDSPWAVELGKKTIDARQAEPPEQVMEIYSASAQLQQLNQRFGYS